MYLEIDLGCWEQLVWFKKCTALPHSGAATACRISSYQAAPGNCKKIIFKSYQGFILGICGNHGNLKKGQNLEKLCLKLKKGVQNLKKCAQILKKCVKT